MDVINNTFFLDVKSNESTFLESDNEEEFVFRYLIVLINKSANTQGCIHGRPQILNSHIKGHNFADNEVHLLYTTNQWFSTL